MRKRNIRVGERHFYICVILDLFSRKVIAHKISPKNSTQLVSSTLKQAIAEREVKAGLIFHSDRGTQYASHSFCSMLKSYSIVQSFSNTGKPHDNAVTETFFSALKREELYRKDYPSEKKFKQAVDTYMTFYNTKRPHKTLKNLTPCQAEEQFCICQKDTQRWHLKGSNTVNSPFPILFFTCFISCGDIFALNREYLNPHNLWASDMKRPYRILPLT